MKIRKQQMEAFSKSCLEEFVARMVRHLRDNFPRERQRNQIPESALEALVRKGIDDAAGYGVVYEMDIQLYLECLVTFGPKFGRDARTAWAGQVLRRDDLDGEAKMDEIGERILIPIEGGDRG